jgi:hypothetical protein
VQLRASSEHCASSPWEARLSANPETLRSYAGIFEKRIAKDTNPLFPQAAPPGQYRDPNPIDVAAAKALRFMADHLEKEGDEAAAAANAVLTLGSKCLEDGQC